MGSGGRIGRVVATLLFILLAGHAWGAPARVGVASFALWSDQGVFRSEAREAARVIAARYKGPPAVLRVNTKAAFAAGPRGMVQALLQASRGLDPERDVLFVVLTSHGSPDGIAEKGGGVDGILAPATLAALLAHSPVRHKVLVVSACFGGVFTTLADPDLLVVTAADAGHPSFGCTAGARWTYFGRAFFDEAMRRADPRTPLGEVFRSAAASVRARELAEGFEPSNPQMAGGADVLPILDGAGAEAVAARRRGATSR